MGKKGFVLALAFLIGCSPGIKPEDLRGLGLGDVGDGGHRGPVVAAGEAGPARFAAALLAAYDPLRAMRTAAFADRYYREPANEGFEATLDHVLDELRALGFGTEERLALEVLETPLRRPAWTPRSASLELVAGGRAEVLHAFSAPEDRDRTMLPAGAPEADVAGPLAFALDELDAGEVLVTDLPLGAVLEAARSAGAAAVLSGHLAEFNVDPSGRRRHLDAIHYGSAPGRGTLPVAHVSPRTLERLRRAPRGTQVRLRADVALEERVLRTLVATVLGDGLPGQAVALAAHVQEPGAVDNASGVAGQLEAVRALVGLLWREQLEWPARSIVFLWGDEIRMSRVFLDDTDLEIVAAFSSDMTGASRAATGALALLERAPDPGALRPLPPDEHTAWGATPVEESELDRSGISVVARMALVDVGRAAGGWESSEHPWEGGSDHDVFLARGIPAVLIWHFTDFAYHTSLDRIEHVDPAELERTSVALLAAALAVADPRPADLDRYLESLSLDRRLRQQAARDAGDAELEAAWGEWCVDAQLWLRALALGLPFDDPLRR